MPQAGLQGLDLAAIAAYFALTFGVSLWFSRRQKSTEDYFVGGRHMPWFAVGLSILATLFSTLSYLGMPGEMIKHGIGLFIGLLAIPLSASVVLLLWIPFYMRLRLTSAYEYLEHRFSYPVRLLGAVLFCLLRMGWMSMVIYAASMALDTVKGGDWDWLPGIDLYWTIGLIGVLSAVYTALGGIQAVIWIDVLQCLLLLGGILMAVFSVAFQTGTGPADWWRIAAEQAPRHTTPEIFSLDLTVRVTIVTAILNSFFWTVCTHGSDQVVLQRYFTTPSIRAARRSYLTNIGVDLTMWALLGLTGLALFAFFSSRPDLLPPGQTSAGQSPDKLFPHFLGHMLPAGCAGLVIAAFFCDAMQTLESGVNAITAVANTDLSRRRARDEQQGRELRRVRLLTLQITALVTAVAYGVAWVTRSGGLTLVDLMPKFFNLFVGPLAGMFVAGMFLRRCTARSVLPAALCGLTVSILWSWWKEITGASAGPTILLAIAVPALTTLGIAALGGLLEGSGDHPGTRYCWREIMARPDPAASTETPPSDGTAPMTLLDDNGNDDD